LSVPQADTSYLALEQTANWLSLWRATEVDAAAFDDIAGQDSACELTALAAPGVYSGESGIGGAVNAARSLSSTVTEWVLAPSHRNVTEGLRCACPGKEHVADSPSEVREDDEGPLPGRQDQVRKEASFSRRSVL